MSSSRFRGEGDREAAFALARRTCKVFVGHDLDAGNLALLQSGQLSAVLHHDLQHDMRMACLQVMCAHGVGGAGDHPGECAWVLNGLLALSAKPIIANLRNLS
jgi:hypothetical protein